jgi:hypothetical protein
MLFRICLALSFLLAPITVQADMIDYPTVVLRTLDKSTARTDTIEVNIGETVEFGSLFIKVQSCRKSEPLDKPESASFLQIWEVPVNSDKSEWVFSGWMFASSPALSAMDHSVYDVWVLDCKGRQEDAPVTNSVKIGGEEVPLIDEETENSEEDSASEQNATEVEESSVEEATEENEVIEEAEAVPEEDMTDEILEESDEENTPINAEDLNNAAQKETEQSINDVIEEAIEEDSLEDYIQYDNQNIQ